MRGLDGRVDGRMAAGEGSVDPLAICPQDRAREIDGPGHIDPVRPCSASGSYRVEDVAGGEDMEA